MASQSVAALAFRGYFSDKLGPACRLAIVRVWWKRGHVSNGGLPPKPGSGRVGAGAVASLGASGFISSGLGARRRCLVSVGAARASRCVTTPPPPLLMLARRRPLSRHFETPSPRPAICAALFLRRLGPANPSLQRAFQSNAR